MVTCRLCASLPPWQRRHYMLLKSYAIQTICQLVSPQFYHDGRSCFHVCLTVGSIPQKDHYEMLGKQLNNMSAERSRMNELTFKGLHYSTYRCLALINKIIFYRDIAHEDIMMENEVLFHMLSEFTNQITYNKIRLSYFPEIFVTIILLVGVMIRLTVLCVVMIISLISHHAMLVALMLLQTR